MWSRPKRFTALLASLAVTTLGVLWFGGTTPAAAAPDIPGSMPGGWVSTQWGPLGPADRDLLIKVRQAGLWEMAAGELAQDRAASARVKEVGRIIADQHADLDRQTLQAAARLGVGLPADPNADQKGFLATLGQLRGDAFDRAYAQLLRDAHGKVFTVIAGVRAGTRNEMMRAFAEVGNGFVMTHMRLLESTTFVNYDALPEAPPPPPGAAAMAAAAQAAGLPGLPASPALDPAVLWVVLAVAVIAALATSVRVFRRR
ncbi:hypothetical protein GCM10010124_19800 [Pilimelia terevasa]|uniref:DUF4142 domain-containing protein n=1 Tax=Pilimelia terevasa TaxID=53372 RepID=A0A8J3FH33_9ACTN|nr:DUF4142 domain-containing protein [Pilimelia terevasa]GGK27211.1 hypothetical protein GCM10010124_19800 [Pilimelia terevasa]